MPASEAQKRAVRRWAKRNQTTRTVGFYADKEGDMELLAHLDAQPNKSEFIKRLIRNDINIPQNPQPN